MRQTFEDIEVIVVVDGRDAELFVLLQRVGDTGSVS
jgi:hypothetical protein